MLLAHEDDVDGGGYDSDASPAALPVINAEDVELGKQIGAGTQGQVYLARLRGTKQRVVVKQLSLQFLTHDETQRTRREAELMLNAHNHPNVVRLLGTYEDANTLNLVMEACRGGSLHTLLNTKPSPGTVLEPIPEETILDWLVQLLLALKHLHSVHILHRDIKPANIFLSRSHLIIKLGDFGIAKQLDSTHDLAETCVGTPCYMPPEVMNGAPYTYAADVWGLGCIAYEMAVRERAFNARTLPALIMQILDCRYKPLPSRYSRPFAALVDSMLRAAAEERPTAAALLAVPFVRRHAEAMMEKYTHHPLYPTLSVHLHALAPDTAPFSPMRRGRTTPLPRTGTITKAKRKSRQVAGAKAATVRAAMPGRTAKRRATGIDRRSEALPPVVAGAGAAAVTRLRPVNKAVAPAQKWEGARNFEARQQEMMELRYAVRQQEIRDSRRKARDSDERVQRAREEVSLAQQAHVQAKRERRRREAAAPFIAPVLTEGELEDTAAAFRERPRLAPDRTIDEAPAPSKPATPEGGGEVWAITAEGSGDVGEGDADENVDAGECWESARHSICAGMTEHAEETAIALQEEEEVEVDVNHKVAGKKRSKRNTKRTQKVVQSVGGAGVLPDALAAEQSLSTAAFDDLGQRFTLLEEIWQRDLTASAAAASVVAAENGGEAWDEGANGYGRLETVYLDTTSTSVRALGTTSTVGPWPAPNWDADIGSPSWLLGAEVDQVLSELVDELALDDSSDDELGGTSTSSGACSSDGANSDTPIDGDGGDGWDGDGDNVDVHDAVPEGSRAQGVLGRSGTWPITTSVVGLPTVSNHDPAHVPMVSSVEVLSGSWAIIAGGSEDYDNADGDEDTDNGAVGQEQHTTSSTPRCAEAEAEAPSEFPFDRPEPERSLELHGLSDAPPSPPIVAGAGVQGVRTIRQLKCQSAGARSSTAPTALVRTLSGELAGGDSPDVSEEAYRESGDVQQQQQLRASPSFSRVRRSTTGPELLWAMQRAWEADQRLQDEMFVLHKDGEEASPGGHGIPGVGDAGDFGWSVTLGDNKEDEEDEEALNLLIHEALREMDEAHLAGGFRLDDLGGKESSSEAYDSDSSSDDALRYDDALSSDDGKSNLESNGDCIDTCHAVLETGEVRAAAGVGAADAAAEIHSATDLARDAADRASRRLFSG